ncbi:hypothetical protein FACS189426_05190 [Bacteroidia bacterium]|nr:hypothetical protein FACS189426_05190 [Bacteroidia bacterium]
MDNMTFDKIIEFSPENQKVFDELKVKCIKGEIVPYVGAGMSAFARFIPILKGRNLFPTWEGLLKEKYKEYFNRELPKDLIDAAEEIEQKMGKESFYEYIRVTMGGNLNNTEWEVILNHAESQAVFFIPKLFRSAIITTNFDQILEKIHIKQESEIPVAFPNNTQELEEVIDNRKRLIYKIHGCVSDAQNIVLAKSRYGAVYSPSSDLVHSLTKLCSGFHFLFLGCSLTLDENDGTKDYSTKLLLDAQGKSQMPHYAIIECKENATEDEIRARRAELEREHIFPILYKYKGHNSIIIIMQKILTEYENQLFQVPPYSSEFIERKDSVIRKIENKLNNEKTTALTLTGFGGVGKTRIMSEYANKKTNEYKHIIWFNALSADNVREEIRRFDIKEKLIVETEKDTDLIFRVFKNWLKENDNWLFLLDNVEHYKDIKVFFDFDKTISGKRHILITSRRDKQEFPDITDIPISTFELEESRRFLETHTQKTPDEYADKIHELLGGLPLALEQTAAYINERNKETTISYKDYFDLLEKDGTLKILGKGDPERYYSASVGATYNISIQRIKNESAKQLLHLCAFFAPDNIHSEWFVKANGVLPDKLKNDVQNETNFAEIKKDLQAYSLVRIDNSERISMHRLLQEVIRKSLEEEQGKWVDNCVKIANKLVYRNFSKSTSVTDFQNLHPHINNLINCISVENQLIDLSLLYRFMGDGKRYMSDYEESNAWYTKLQNKQENQPYNSNLASTYNAIAENHMYMDEFKKAWIFNRKSQAVYEMMPDNNAESVSDIFNDFGIIRYRQGKYKPAIWWYNRALHIREKTLGKCDKTASTYLNIGACYYKLGKLEEFIKVTKIASKMYEDTVGMTDSHTYLSYSNLALGYSEMGNPPKAIGIYDKVIPIYEEKFGERHAETAKLYHNKAKALLADKQYKEAIDLVNKTILIKEDKLGLYHTSTANSYFLKGQICCQQTNPDFDISLIFFLTSYKVRLSKLGKSNLDTLESIKEMIGVYKETNNSITFGEWLKEKMK